jgi:hypothetical protein
MREVDGLLAVAAVSDRRMICSNRRPNITRMSEISRRESKYFFLTPSSTI